MKRELQQAEAEILVKSKCTMQLIGFAVLLLPVALPMRTTTQALANAIFRGALLRLINDAAAVAIKNGEFLFVCGLSETLKHWDNDTEMFNLDDRAILPGFADSQGRVILGGLQVLSSNLLSLTDGPSASIAILQEPLRTWREENAEATGTMRVRQ